MASRPSRRRPPRRSILRKAGRNPDEVPRSHSFVRGRTARILGLVLALGLAAGPAVAARVVDPATARRETSAPIVAAQDAELTALAAAGRVTELAARLERTAHDVTLTDVAREWLLDHGLHALARTTPTPAARASVARLALLRPAVFTRVDPDHGDRFTPLYDAGATARFVLREWDRAAARDLAATSLLAGRTDAMARFARGPAGGPANDGIADAFRAAPAPSLAGQRAAVADALVAGQRVDRLALILAGRLADAALFGLVIDYAEEPVALDAVPAAARILDASSALELLSRASRRADIASAAVLEIGRLARNDGAARRFLFDAVTEPEVGSSAAAALARLDDPAVSAELGQRLAKAEDEATRRRLVLALRLDAGPAAHAELARFARSEAGSAALQKEVRQWLGR